MRYPLVSRFQGTLLGALLGERLVFGSDQQAQNGYDVDKIAVLGAESLIALGKLDLDDWRSRQQQASPHLAGTETNSPKIILATLPVALFFHENTIKLRQNLLRVLDIWGDNPVVRDGTLAVGYAIAQSLTEKLHPRTLIAETIAFIGETPTSLPQQLLKVNTLLDQGAGLETAQAELSRQDKLSSAIPMAFYCFLSTLEDYRLSVLRATHGDVWRQDHWHLHSQVISAITGALSGSYNSIAGIPVTWQVLHSQANSPALRLSNFSQMVELAAALAAVWSGVYNFTLHPSKLTKEGCVISDEQTSLCVYGSPRVIRSR
ncbi:MAG: ADP-ribosylglycohydrolase family protein [Mojavia pulchra JT2-VF2]|jgi:ADP-ribosylglycohydrolase|uniref:ADP-ribosylglycohydrolase family protein n=1 Tax=Mojavia pulchra JT2-VF2 TaxID=287848 RepID=A0A951Q1L8_9NOST|nr:ADP-ribosylglycohydrolase family protein [Mojavia pulchra JT2-VF2]